MKSCISMKIFVESLAKQISINVDAYDGKTVVVETKYHPRFEVVKIVDKKSR